ncbi:wax synthase family protein [Aspergillus stella-maris]|uniref:wax synthase family protein n=1 Tax=Aspergillus stella-maris TaxID=1810926 RepID=UPI003CCCF7F8
MASALSNLPPWITPVINWNLIQLITGATATFTSSRSPLRPIAAALTAILAYLLQRNIQTYYSGTRPSGPVVAMCWVNVLNAIDLLLLTQASYGAQVAYRKTKDEKKDRLTKSGQGEDGLFKKIVFALVLPYNLRRIKTPWQISRVPHFDESNPAYVPSRSSFLLQSLGKLVVAGAFIALLPLDPQNPLLVKAVSKLDQTKSVLFYRNYDAYSILLQAGFTLSFGVVTRASIVSGYIVGAIFAVLLGGDPAEWPPVAGSLREAWSLERLWGRSWHQTLRRPLTSNATFLSSTLGLSPSSLPAHWIRVVIAFLGSGLVHALMDIGFGVEWEKTGALWFYGLQIVGFVVEGVLKTMLTPVANTLGLGRCVRRGVGYIWVAGFLLWSTPVWINPILVSLRDDGTNVMSPWLGGPPGWY